jgi:hypothetical protein
MIMKQKKKEFLKHNKICQFVSTKKIEWKTKKVTERERESVCVCL